jgi:predicted O-methyltransferase YrrM
MQNTRRLRSFFGRPLPRPDRLSISFVASRPGWLQSQLPQTSPFAPPRPDDFALIERRAAATQQAGAKPLWEGYREVAGYARSVTEARTSNEVRSDATMGCFFAWLVGQRRPATIVEIGTAFGVSGMYWLAGLKAIGAGWLLTFEPNAIWADIAAENLHRIDGRYRLTCGTFEDHIEATIGADKFDIAFVDAIHTGEFVFRQLSILRRHAAPGALVLFDDIDFSDDMHDAWTAIASGPGIVSSALLGERVGIVELAPSPT